MNDLFASSADQLVKEMAQQFSPSALGEIADAADKFAELAAKLSGFAGVNGGEDFRRLAFACRRVIELGRD